LISIKDIYFEIILTHNKFMTLSNALFPLLGNAFLA